MDVYRLPQNNYLVKVIATYGPNKIIASNDKQGVYNALVTSSYLSMYAPI